MDNLLFGSDPEVFVVEKKDNKEWALPVPFFINNYHAPVLEIDQDHKHPVLFKDNNYAIMMDGVAFEYTLPPVKTARDMFNNIQSGLNRLRDYASKLGYEVSIKPAVNYDFDRFYSERDTLSVQCGLFGCDRDWDAVLGNNYDSPSIDATKHPYRYGGGHFHMSDYNQLLRDYPIPMIKFMAICQGNYSIAHSKYLPLEKLRAWKYGQPARYRIQNYKDGITGIEYRTPSNHWIETLETIEGMFSYAQKAYSYLAARRLDIINEFLEPTIKAISEADASLANRILTALP
jgi:hypothetical protein